MGFRYRPDPLIERQLLAESQGLMQDERNAGMMPNTPRDPERVRREKELMEKFLKGGGGPGYGLPNARPIYPPGQNPFAERVPDADEMALAQAATQHSRMQDQPQAPVPNIPGMEMIAGTPDSPIEPSQDNLDHLNPMAPTIDRADKELLVDRPSDLPGTEDNPKMPNPSQDLNSNPGQAALRDALMDKASKPPAQQRVESGPGPEYLTALSDSNNTNRNLALVNLFAKSANQMGSIGGKVADSSGIDSFTKAAMDGNSDSMKYLSSMENERVKNQSKASAKDDSSKLMLEMYKLGQQSDIAKMNDKTRQDYNGVMGGIRKSEVEQRGELARGVQAIQKDANDIRRNPPARNLNPIEEEAIRAEIDLRKANAKKAAKESVQPKRANLPLGLPEDIIDKRKRLSKRSAMIQKMDAAYKQYSAMPDGKEKRDYGLTFLKMMNDPENPDAAGAEEAKRVGANLDQYVRPKEAIDWALGNGAAPVGYNYQAFGDIVKNQLQAMKKNQVSEQSSLDSLYKQNGLPPGGVASDGTPIESGRKVVDRFYSASRKKTRIVYSDGSEEIVDGKQ